MRLRFISEVYNLNYNLFLKFQSFNVKKILFPFQHDLDHIPDKRSTKFSTFPVNISQHAPLYPQLYDSIRLLSEPDMHEYLK